MAASSSRTDGLIRDIAQLLVSYPTEAWKPIIDALSEGSPMYVRIAEAVKALKTEAGDSSVKPSARKARGQVRGKATASRRKKKLRAVDLTDEMIFSPQRQEVLGVVKGALEKKLILQTMSDLRQMYLLSGGKEKLPKSRNAACLLLLRQLDSSTDNVFEGALDLLRENATVENPFEGGEDSYDRWFKLIRPQS